MMLMRILALALAIVSVLPGNAFADTHTMTACTQAAFNTAYSAASSGDTIAFPAGTCNITGWSEVGVTKTNITIKGSGYNSTSLTGSAAAFSFADETGNGFRIEGIKFIGFNQAIYIARGTQYICAKDWSIVNNYFEASGVTTRVGVMVYMGGARGVIAGNTFHNTYSLYLEQNGADQTYFPLHRGSAITSTENVIFVEGNNFRMDLAGACPSHFALVQNWANRVIFRHNNLDMTGGSGCQSTSPIDAHDACENYGSCQNSSGCRGTLGGEIYNNAWIWGASDTPLRAMDLRGGQWTVYKNYSNKTVDWDSLVRLYSYEKCESGNCYAGATTCTGNIWDTNSGPTDCFDQINHTYVWANRENCGSNTETCPGQSDAPHLVNDCSGTIAQNTHYFTSAPAGYTAYTCPHPLAGSGSCDSAKAGITGYSLTGGSDTTAPTVTISTANPSSISANSLSVAWSSSDDVGVTGCKYRIGAAPDASNGTSATSPATATGFSVGANTLYVGCTDAAGNWGSSSITVNYTLAGKLIGGKTVRGKKIP